MNVNLVEQLGRLGDQLHGDRIAQHEYDLGDRTEPVREAEWSFLIHHWNRAERGGCLSILLLLLFGWWLFLVLDAVHFLFRCMIYPLVWLVYCWHRRCAFRRGRYFLCPVCQNVMPEARLICRTKGCRRPVQPPLRPTFHEWFTMRCGSCGESCWSVFGQWSHPPVGALVCLRAGRRLGCCRRIRISALAGGRLTNIAVAGTSLSVKHAAFAHLALHLTERAGYAAGWKGTQLELRLARQVLCLARTRDTSALERPGRNYYLFSPAVFHSAQTGRVVTFRNVAQRWLNHPEELAREGPNWGCIDRLVLNVEVAAKGMPGVEMYSRLLRDVEEYLAVPPGGQLRLRVAVFLVTPKPVADAEAAARDHVPALLALLRRTLRAGHLRFFAGPLPDSADIQASEWLGQGLAWLLG